MYHLFSRVYLEVDSLKTDKHAFYLASAAMAENYDDRLEAGPVMMGKTTDEVEFVSSGFAQLLTKLKGSGNNKLIIYTSLASYGALVAQWIRAVFPNAKSSQIKELLNLEFLTLHTQGLPLPKAPALNDMLAGFVNTPANPDLRIVARDIPEKLSLEYKLLDYLSDNKRVSIADSIRVFALRGVMNTLRETQRNLISLFFSDYMQKKYGYDARQYVGEFDLLRKIPRLKILNDPNLNLRITRLKPEVIESVVKDYELYLEQVPALEQTQVEAERAKLQIVNTTNPLDDDAVTDLFISMLRSSNEHTDYLDWADIDKLNVHLIHWAVGLEPRECKGFEL